MNKLVVLQKGDIMEHIDETPIYQQIIDFLVGKIKAGSYLEKQRIPSERELCIKFGVSRMTARKAIDHLVQEGYVKRVVGKGTFVSKKKISRDFIDLLGFNEHLKKSGYENLKVKLIRKEERIADEKIAHYLNVEQGEAVYIIERVRLLDQEPISVEKTYLLKSKFKGILDVNFEQESLFNIIHDHYHAQVVRSEVRIEMIRLVGKNANLLKQKVGSPAFKVFEVEYDDKDDVIKVTRAFNVADLFSYVLEQKKSRKK